MVRQVLPCLLIAGYALVAWSSPSRDAQPEGARLVSAGALRLPAGRGQVTGAAFVGNDTLVAEWDGEHSRIHRFRADGGWAGQVGEPGRAPGQFLSAHHLSAAGESLLAVLDQKSYRVSYFALGTRQLSRSFLFSHLSFAPTGGVASPRSDRFYILALERPQVWGFSLGGELVFTSDVFSGEAQRRNLTTDSDLRAAAAPDGTLLCAARNLYSIARLSPRGDLLGRFGRPGPRYRQPGPSAAAGTSPQRRSFSLIDNLVISGNHLLVSYSVPDSRDSLDADLYRLNGSPLAAGIRLPGRLLAGDAKGRLAVLGGDPRAVLLFTLRREGQ